MGVFAGPEITESGLVLALDAGNSKSYPGSGTTVTDLSGNGVTATLSNYTNITSPYLGIRLNADTGRINLSTITNITTVELWFYQHTNTGFRYLLDMRSGGAGGWFYQSGVGPAPAGAGSNWSSGKIYVNGVDYGVPVWNTMENLTYQKYAQVIMIANTPATDDMNLFSRFSNDESMDVTFYIARVYNRALTAQEIQQNFIATRSRFSI